MAVCRYVVEVYLDGVLKERNITEQDRQLLIDYLQCICFGFVIGWLESGMKEGIRERFARIYELKHGDLERMISAVSRCPLKNRNLYRNKTEGFCLPSSKS